MYTAPVYTEVLGNAVESRRERGDAVCQRRREVCRVQ